MKPIYKYRMFIYPLYFFWMMVGIKTQNVGLFLGGVATCVVGQLGGIWLMEQLGRDILAGKIK